MAEYSWEDYRVIMGGRFVTGIRGFRYKLSQDKEPIYAEGNKPHSMGRGNKHYECELSCLQSELEAIIMSAGGDPTEVPPFTVLHQYVKKGGGPVITDAILDVEFKELEKNMKQGDMFMEVTLPCVCMDIKFHTVTSGLTKLV